MVQLLTVILMSLTSIALAEEVQESTRGFGLALNSGLNGEVYPMRLILTALYSTEHTQFGFGIGFHPFIHKDQRIFSGELNYKLFPNGMVKKVNMFFLFGLDYISNQRDTFYPTTYHYLFFNAGHGFQISPFPGAFLGTSVNYGIFTYRKDSDNPAASYLNARTLFKEFGYSLGFEFSLGYRF